MVNLLRKLIEWAFYEYVVEHELEKNTLEELEDYPLPEDEEEATEWGLEDDLVIIFEPDEAFVDSLKEILEFEDEEQQAMYEKQFHTEQ